MDYYPICIDIKDKPCLVVGGGKVAARKAEGLFKAGARVTVIAPEIDPSIQNATKISKRFEPADIRGYSMVIAATSDGAVNAEVARGARENNILVNVVDNKELSDFILPSVVDRSPLVISISTSGAAPFFAKEMRKELESRYGPEYAEIVRSAAGKRKAPSPLRLALRARSGQALPSPPHLNPPPQGGRNYSRGEGGKVYLAGAGPGDPGLITLRVLNLIRTADVILYDSLVNPALLSYKKEGAIIHYCGKAPSPLRLALRARSGQAQPSPPHLHPSPQGGRNNSKYPPPQGGRNGCGGEGEQDEINELMLTYARSGKSVLRLKGGDPWLFARGAEEAEFLLKNNIPFEIVPGVTSPLAAAAYAGIPISHRDHSSSIAMATGHLKKGKTISDIKIPQADTIIYLMAVENLSQIVDKLISSGQPPGRPAALIQDGTTGRQRTVTADLGSIVDAARKEAFKAPAVFIVGEAVGLRNQPGWYEKLPLFGKRFVVTRPAAQAGEMLERLAQMGADVTLYPTIEIVESEGAREFFKSSDPLNGYTDTIFTSENGVRIFFKNIYSANLDARELAGKRIYAIGPNTREALLENGIVSEPLPTEYTSQGLLDELPQDLSGRYFLLPRADQATPVLEEGLLSRRAEVKKLALYRLEKPAGLQTKVAAPFRVRNLRRLKPQGYHTLKFLYINIGKADGVIFTSSMTATNFFEMAVWPKGAVAFCIGKTTAEALAGRDIKTVIAPSATSEALVDTIVEYWAPSPPHLNPPPQGGRNYRRGEGVRQR